MFLLRHGAALCDFAKADRPSTLGGADRDRTDDLRLAKPALSQLSYSPEGKCGGDATYNSGPGQS